MAMTLRTTPEADAALTELARAQGISKNEAVLRAILRDRQRITRSSVISALTEEALDQWSETLDRLGRE
jgi:uncharacterized protein (DUF1778 family)